MSNDKLNPVLKNITSWYMRINKKYEENVTVYQIFFIKVTYAELNYARTLFVLKYQVPFHLMKSYFCYPILKTIFFSRRCTATSKTLRQYLLTKSPKLFSLTTYCFYLCQVDSNLNILFVFQHN